MKVDEEENDRGSQMMDLGQGQEELRAWQGRVCVQFLVSIYIYIYAIAYSNRYQRIESKDSSRKMHAKLPSSNNI